MEKSHLVATHERTVRGRRFPSWLIAGAGYPVYVLTILGVWKLLGVIALLVPGFPRRKRMGLCWPLLRTDGALASGIVRGGDPGTVIFSPIILALITLACLCAATAKPDPGRPLSRQDPGVGPVILASSQAGSKWSGFQDECRNKQ